MSAWATIKDCLTVRGARFCERATRRYSWGEYTFRLLLDMRCAIRCKVPNVSYGWGHQRFVFAGCNLTFQCENQAAAWKVSSQLHD